MDLRGRRVLTSSATMVTPENVVSILNHILPTYEYNQREIMYLFNYYLGDQDVLRFKEKVVRPEINNRIVVNHAYEIVTFHAGYVYSDPIQYVRRGATSDQEDSGDEISDKVAQLNRWVAMEDKSTCDKYMGTNQAICGTSYRMVLPDAEPYYDDAPFEMESLDPKTTGVVYSTSFGHKPLMSIQQVILDTDETLYIVYTPDRYYEIADSKHTGAEGDERFSIVRETENPLGLIPVVEYPANQARLGTFEPVISLLNALNNLTSDRLDGVQQFVQSLMKFVNCDFDENLMKEIQELGAVAVKSTSSDPADVDIMTQELNQTQTQTLMDDLYKRVLIICGLPDRESSTSASDTGAAVLFRDGWASAETRARDTELEFKRSERDFLRLVLKIAKDTEGFELPLREIEVKFTRNRTDNLLVKTQGMLTQLSAGIHPQIVISNSGLYSDPEQVYVDSLPYLEKWKLDNKTNYNPNQNGEVIDVEIEDPDHAQRSV